MSRGRPLGLFEGYGIELEYMIVSRRMLDVLPIADDLLARAHGRRTNDHLTGRMGWSNEFVQHVLELRNDEPVRSIDGLAAEFQGNVRRINRLLKKWDARLMPSGMHPWMNPACETRLWTGKFREIYARFDRIFDCHRHGWANLQSCQINLPFANDREFARLHAAVRLVLPLVPALAASSPVVESRVNGRLDNRLAVYLTNASRIRSVAGACIPEPVYTRADYTTRILKKIYRDMRKVDPGGILRHEWVNGRGAITRFDRGAIEIRLLDMQECPAADLALTRAVIAVVRALVEERHASHARQKAVGVKRLLVVLRSLIRNADRAVVRDRELLACLGVKSRRGLTAREVWREIIERDFPRQSTAERRDLAIVHRILDQGVLARRIARALGRAPSARKLRGVYRDLCACLEEGRLFGIRG